MMRFVVALLAVVLVLGLGVIGWTTVFRPPPAAERLAGVDVGVAGFTVEDIGDHRHRLTLTVSVNSIRDVDECLGFALDEPFAGRRLATLGGGCARPRAGRQAVRLGFDGLTDDDVAFPSHTLVWGIPGGRCGPILGVFGVCVVDQAGTAKIELPAHNPLPSFSFGSIGPFFSFFSFPPP